MSKWYIARATNMSFVKVVLNLLDHGHWADQQNTSAIPSGLADWGFLLPANGGVYNDTGLGKIAMSAEWGWREIVLHALSKRGAFDQIGVKPMVVMAKTLLQMKKHMGLQSSYLTDRSFTRLADITSYDQITETFCLALNDPDRPGEPAKLAYFDIWLNALDAAGILEKENNKYMLRNNHYVFEFLSLLDDHGLEMSACPDKDVSADDYYKYMGDVTKGLPEILAKASDDLLNYWFPNFRRGAFSWTSLVPQTNVSKLNEISDSFAQDVVNLQCGLTYSDALVQHFIAALSAKPFVVLTGLSGSGKTKLAQAFVDWISIRIFGLDNCFYPGLVVKRANTDLNVKAVDSVGMVIAQGNGSLACLSHELIDQWVDTIVKNGYSISTSTATVRYQVIAEHPQYSDYMHRFDSTLKPLAFYKIEHSTPYTIRTSLLVPVGADWTNSEKLLGYPNALDKDEYVMPDTGVLKLLMDAEKNPTLPFFLILDEMNLSHVERYFADFLSAMESGDEIKLYDGDQRYGDKEKTIAIPRKIRVPKNLFVIGTMNVDETTYMFSPKVLDRAQVIEFRVKEDEMATFVGHVDENGKWIDGTASKVDLSNLADANGVGKGAKYAESFLKLALERGEKKPSNQPIPAAPAGHPANPDEGKTPLQEVAKALNAFFKPLAELGAEFGYRSASEIFSFCGYYLDTGATIDDAIDAAIVQKLLPKLHGSQQRLGPVLRKLKELASKSEIEADGGEQKKVMKPLYKLTCEKIDRMLIRLKANGFTSFAEA